MAGSNRHKRFCGPPAKPFTPIGHIVAQPGVEPGTKV